MMQLLCKVLKVWLELQRRKSLRKPFVTFTTKSLGVRHKTILLLTICCFSWQTFEQNRTRKHQEDKHEGDELQLDGEHGSCSEEHEIVRSSRGWTLPANRSGWGQEREGCCHESVGSRQTGEQDFKKFLF